MGSRTPVKKKLLEDIKLSGGWTAILDRISGGETIAHIAGTFKRPDGVPISRTFFTGLLHRYVPEDKIAAAKTESADSHAERALEIAETALPERDHVAKAKLEIEQHNYLARVNNRERFAVDRPGAVQPTINIGSLHLEILRSKNAPQIASAAELPALPAIIEDDNP